MCYHWDMAQLLVRNVPDFVVQAIRERAIKHGRSAEAEHRAILEAGVKLDWSEFRKEAARLREETRGRVMADSTDLIREDRDSR